MAITGVDTLLAGLLPPYSWWKTTFTGEAAGEWFSPFYVAGNPGAAVAPTPGLAGAALTTYAGQLPAPAAVAGDTVYCADFTAQQGGVVGCVLLCDRLWHNSGFTMTTTAAETVNSVAWPTRDYSLSTAGVDVMVGLEVSSATGNVGAITNTTVSYTNSAGTAGRTATLSSYPATAVAGTWVPLSLQAGDVGVRSVQSITLGTSYVSGAIHLCAWRLVAELEVPAANTGYIKSFTGLNLPIVWDSSVLQLVYWPTGTTAGSVAGSLWYAQG